MARLTFRKVLQELDGREFESARALQEAVRHAFNRRVFSFPSGYPHFAVIKRGLNNNWIEILPNDCVVIYTKDGEASTVW